MTCNLNTSRFAVGSGPDRCPIKVDTGTVCGLLIRRHKLAVIARLSLALAALLLVAGAFVLPAQAQSGWLDPAWSYRNQVNVANSGAIPSNFQVRIVLDSSFPFANAQNNGADLRVTDADGTTSLPFWIEKWDATNTSAVVWVNGIAAAWIFPTFAADFANAVVTGPALGE
jgi:hypothetical protein